MCVRCICVSAVYVWCVCVVYVNFVCSICVMLCGKHGVCVAHV